MFTGIIEETGTVRSVTGGADGAVLDIGASRVLEGTREGDSIAVNGVCLTVSPGSGHFRASVMPETLRRTSLRNIPMSDMVNMGFSREYFTSYSGNASEETYMCYDIRYCVVKDIVISIVKVSLEEVPPEE